MSSAAAWVSGLAVSWLQRPEATADKQQQTPQATGLPHGLCTADASCAFLASFPIKVTHSIPHSCLAACCRQQHVHVLCACSLAGPAAGHHPGHAHFCPAPLATTHL